MSGPWDADDVWAEWSCVGCRKTVRTTYFWIRKLGKENGGVPVYGCPHSGQLPWMSDEKAHAALLRRVGKHQPKEDYNPVTIQDIDLEAELPKLNYDALVSVAELYDSKSWQKRNLAGSKARDYAYHNVPAWANRQNRAVNGILRALRYSGAAFTTDKTMALMAAAEYGVLAQSVPDDFLTPEEMDLLWGPLAEAVAAVIGTEREPVAYQSTVGTATPKAKARRQRAPQASPRAQEAPLSDQEKAEAAAMLGLAPAPADDDLAAELDALLGLAAEPAPPVPDTKVLDAQMLEHLTVTRTNITTDDLDDLLNEVA